MTFHAKATYENGVLRLEQPLPLKDNQQVQLTIHIEQSHTELLYGIMGWTGEARVLEEIAEDPDLGILGSP